MQQAAINTNDIAINKNIIIFLPNSQSLNANLKAQVIAIAIKQNMTTKLGLIKLLNSQEQNNGNTKITRAPFIIIKILLQHLDV